jgi:DnaJ-class molecular chaperone
MEEAAMATRTDGTGTGEAPPGTADVRNPGDQAAPGAPQTGETTCPECGGSGRAGGGDCPNCGGTGQVVQIVGDA